MTKNARKRAVAERRRTCCPTCRHSLTAGTIRFDSNGTRRLAKCKNCEAALKALMNRAFPQETAQQAVAMACRA